MKTLTTLLILTLSTISSNASDCKTECKLESSFKISNSGNTFGKFEHIAVNKFDKNTCAIFKIVIFNFEARYSNQINKLNMKFYIDKVNNMKKKYNKNCK